MEKQKYLWIGIPAEDSDTRNYKFGGGDETGPQADSNSVSDIKNRENLMEVIQKNHGACPKFLDAQPVTIMHTLNSPGCVYFQSATGLKVW
ncbi:MAG: hypothetical protein ACLFTB_01020 [Desulfovibrionales bacterium]